jgi:hypothetical protein
VSPTVASIRLHPGTNDEEWIMADDKDAGQEPTGEDSDDHCGDRADVSPMQDPHPQDDDGLASGAYRRLVTWIREFEDQLDDDMEVGVRLVTFGRAQSFHLCDLSYWNPHFIRFIGSDPAGNPVQLIQHINQISVLLMKAPKQNDEPRRIGFQLASALPPA